MNILPVVRIMLCSLLAFGAAVAAEAPANAAEPSVTKGAAPAAKPSSLSAKASSKPAAKKASAQAKSAPTSKTARKAKSRKEADAIATPVPSAKLDLTLPKAMVDTLEPPSKEAQTPVAGKPLLPAMFADKKPTTDDFQVGGRILSNEMDLPMMRNEGRRDIEGAALDFKFKQ